MPLQLPPNLAACLSVADSHLINISTPSLQALLEKRCFMTLIAVEPDILIKVEILLKNTQYLNFS